jgi:hypothetical protein
MRKVFLVLLALAGFGVFAVGGVETLLGPEGLALDGVELPIPRADLIDVGIALLSLFLLAGGLTPSASGGRMGRTHLLQGVALGSAIVVCVSIALVLRFHGATDPRLPGALALVAVLQAAVGLLAGLLLLVRRESRMSGITPVLANGGLTALVVVLTHGQHFE